MVGVDERGGQRRRLRGGEERLEAGAYVAEGRSVRMGRAQVPFDAAGQCRARQVAAADERDAVTAADEDVGLRVEGLRVYDPEEAHPQAGVAGRQGVKPLERVRVGDAQVVAREHPDRRAALEGVDEVLLEQCEAGRLYERGDDVDLEGDAERLLAHREELAFLTRHEGVERGEGVALRRRRGGVVLLLGRDDAPHAAARVVDVAAKARDDVDVQVHHGLARGLASVETDVVTGGAQLTVEQLTDRRDRPDDGVLLLERRLEPRSDVPARQDQRVAR